MCSFCDRLNYGIMSLHNEVALNNKTDKEYTDESIFVLSDNSGHELGRFQFPACPMCRRPLGQVGKDMFGDLSLYVVYGYQTNYVKGVIQTVEPTNSIVTPLMALTALANKLNLLVRMMATNIPYVVEVNFYEKRVELLDEYKNSSRFELKSYEMGRETVNGVGLFEYTLTDKETDMKFVLGISRLEQ